METDFTKGIHTNTDPVNTPPGYYRGAKNMRISGNSKRSEEGMVKMESVPANFIQWGNCAIGNQTILLGQINSKTVIGSLDTNDNWAVEVPARAGVDVLAINEPVQVEGKKNWAGERVIYFATPAGARRINLDKDLPSGDTDFDKVTSLFLEYDLPKVVYLGENNAGILLSGSYQLAARLVTDSGAETVFGIPSGVIPVVPTSLQSSRDAVVGAPPQEQTTKAFSLRVENIDASFKYIQLGILTYVGLANIPTVHYSTLILINGQTSLEVTYSGERDNFEQGSLEEFIISGISYETGKYLTQKDGTLLMAAPVEANLLPIDWYRVAENMTAEFIVKRISFQESLKFEGESYTQDEDATPDIRETSSQLMDQGYKNPITCELFKGYRRGEVYGFTLTPVFTSGVYGPTVHIPADHSSLTEASNATGDPNDGGTLGTYVSEHTYPDDRYPGIAAGQGVRLHKFPTVQNQPLIEGNVETSTCYIRVLGVKFTGIALDASETQYASQIAGFIIGRLDRNGNETKLAQGIVRPNIDIRYLNQNDYTYGPMIGDGFFFWQTAHGPDLDSDMCRPWGAPKLDDFTMLAPDLIHGLYSIDSASYIRQHSIYLCDPYVSQFEFHRTAYPGREDGWARTKGFFKNITGESLDIKNSDLNITETQLAGERLMVGPFGVPRASNSQGGKETYSFVKGIKVIQMSSSDGFAWLSTLGGGNIQYLRDEYSHYYGHSRVRTRNDHEWLFNTVIDSHSSHIGELESEGHTRPADPYRPHFILHELIRRNTKQYGPLDQMVGMFTHYEMWDGFSGEVEFYNGDTFINKYGLTINDEGFYAYSTSDSSNDPDKIGYLRAPNASGIVNFWLESNNNYAYRHYIQATSFSAVDIAGNSGSVPFYPAYKQLLASDTPFGLLSMYGENWVRPGYASQYNNQYSAQPNIKPYAVTPKEDTERKASLVNRIIYSAAAVQGEKTDAYQIFLPNNFYDVPQEYGELTDIYVFNELFASTNQVQWQLYFNTLAAQLSTVGELVLGTGGAFNRPATPMITVDGGYGGTSHWLHAINTIFGRIFVDRLQGKFFSLNKQLEYFSGDLNDLDRIDIQQLTNDDILIGSEPLRERVFIKVGDIMWSYNMERKVFVSQHTYKPRWMFSHGSFMYSNQLDAGEGNVGMFKHSKGISGEFYGVVHPASITIVLNAGKARSKHLKTIEILSERVTEAGLNLPFDTFNQIAVFNKERYTGLLDITPKTNAFQIPLPMEVLAAKVKDSFRMVVSRDIVIDPKVDIFALSNHAQLRGDTVLTKWLPKIRGTYIEIKLITDNSQGPIFLFDVLVSLSENIR
ncbi:hypothetical protein LCGC14_0984250 [marine sediment metagenome]|uniref:Crassvirus muzzle protein N-terminal region domain-containing protein n=1 Tax=marine sediment metagenome TaxID=412755 RepID=A0A0F9NCB6_9ZZZZ|nr:hypothetical protein [Bacteroides sp.]